MLSVYEFLQRCRFIAPILHELARQFDGIPGHAVDAGNGSFIDAGQQVMQAVAEFVEQRHDFVVRQQCRFARQRWREIASQISDRLLQAMRGMAAVDALVHRSEEHTSELQSLMRNSYAVFCLKKKNKT